MFSSSCLSSAMPLLQCVSTAAKDCPDNTFHAEQASCLSSAVLPLQQGGTQHHCQRGPSSYVFTSRVSLATPPLQTEAEQRPEVCTAKECLCAAALACPQRNNHCSNAITSPQQLLNCDPARSMPSVWADCPTASSNLLPPPQQHHTCTAWPGCSNDTLLACQCTQQPSAHRQLQ